MSACMACKFWSELIAKSEGGQVVALCLKPESPNYSQYTAGRVSCAKFESGPPIDDPHPRRKESHG